MAKDQKALACILSSLALCTAADGVVAAPSGNPYQGIVARNVFALKAPAPQPDPAEVNKPQPSKITLTGIMTILGRKQALMKAPPLPPSKAGEQPKERSYILAEGQRDGGIEVVQIDAERNTVKIINAGIVETLSFEKNGSKPASAAQPGPLGAIPSADAAAAVPSTTPYPGMNASLTPTAVAGGTGNVIPGWRRFVRPAYPQ